jgi:hypothetical protein
VPAGRLLWWLKRGWILPHIGAERFAGRIPLDREHIVDSGLGWLISMEE